MQKIKPVNRQDLMNSAVTGVDAFTALRYARHRENTPAIPELEEKGQKSLPNMEANLLDLYHSLWEIEPELKSEIPADRKYWQNILDGALKSNAYQEIHAMTQQSELPSILGTISMGESVIGNISEEDKEKLQKLNAAQQEADQAQQQASQAQQSADTLQQMLAQMQAAGQSQSGQEMAGSSTSQESKPTPEVSAESQSQPQKGSPSGQPSSGMGQMTPEQAKQIANELAKQLKSAQDQASASAKAAADKQSKAEKLAEDLLGKSGSQKAIEKLQQLTRIGLQAIKDAQKKVEEVSETIEAWGLDEGELFKKGIPEALALLKRMQRNKDFLKFAKMLGRIRKIAAKKAKSKIKGEGKKVAKIEFGRDIKRAHRKELVALATPALRHNALKKWAHGELRLQGEKTKAKLGHGPVVVCEDSSGSMSGDKEQWAKAVVLSLANYAQIQKRTFAWIMFDSRVQESKNYPGGKISAEDMLHIAESSSGGGTNFERPLEKAIEMIKNEGLKKADICFITDGECEVSDKFLSEFLENKKHFEVNVITVLCDAGCASNSSVNQFSDKVEKASSFTSEEAEAKIFSNL